MSKDTQSTPYEPLRYKRLGINKTIIIVTEVSDDRIDKLLSLFEDNPKKPRS